MVSRREFLRGGSLAGLTSLVPAATAAVRAKATPANRPYEAVCDTRYPEGDAFLAAVAGQAYRSHGVGNDPGVVLGVLPEAMTAGRAVVGLTTHTALVIAQQVAGPQGYALAYHGEHTHLGDEQLRHRLLGNAAWLADLATLLKTSADGWPSALGNAIPRLTNDQECADRHELSCRATRPQGSPGQLVSWVLVSAPRS